MNTKSFENIINEAWNNKGQVNSKSSRKLLNAISKTIDLLDAGKIRVAEKKNSEWIINQWIKKGILLSFRTNKMKTSKGPYATWYDKVEGKTQKWNEKKLIQAGFRSVPNGAVRKGAFIAKNVVLMPSFVNIGAYVDEGSMIDTWASVGSVRASWKKLPYIRRCGNRWCVRAYAGKPTIIEDNCFIGARAEIAEGVIVEKGSVLSMGVYIGASTRIFDRATGETHYGKVPAYSVVVPGTMPSKNNPDGPSLYCVVIVKKVDEKTRSKTSINDLLRD